MDQTTRNSEKVWIKPFLPMNLTDFLKIPSKIVVFIVTGLMGQSMEILKTLEWREFSWRNIVYNATFSVERHVGHCFPIEYVYFQ